VHVVPFVKPSDATTPKRIHLFMSTHIEKDDRLQVVNGVPALLHINREARKETLKYFEISNTTSMYYMPFYISYERDLLAARDMVALHLLCGYENEPEVFRNRFRNLMVGGFLGTPWGTRIPLLCEFKALENLFLEKQTPIHYPMDDDYNLDEAQRQWHSSLANHFWEECRYNLMDEDEATQVRFEDIDGLNGLLKNLEVSFALYKTKKKSDSDCLSLGCELK